MTRSPGRFTQIGVHLSYYSAKTRSYLLHKRIPFLERGPTPLEFAYTLKRRTGAAAVPVLVTPAGEWLQDSSAIIDTLERRFPERPVLPATPVLRFAAYLFELWGDELWLPMAMHTRWSHPENVPFFVDDISASMLPRFPRWLRAPVGARVARQMQSYLPAVGVAPEHHAVLDRFLQRQLDGLDAHFAEHPFLFGGRPSLGDFGLIGPLYAHVGRDPWSKRELVDTRPRLRAWIERMNDPDSAQGDFLSEDEVPATLATALGSIFDEMVPFLSACCEVLRRSPVLPADTRRAPRMLGFVEYPLAGGLHRRAAASYPVWMVQRLLAAFAAMPPEARERVRGWLGSLGGAAVLALDPPPVRRVGLSAAHVAPAARDATP